MIDIQLESWLQLQIGVAIGCLVQSISGFALGLSMIATIALFDLMPLDQAAMVVTFIGIGNTLLVLSKSYKNINLKYTLVIIITGLPFLFVGFEVLNQLSTNTSGYQLLKRILGITVALCALMLILKPQPKAQPSSMALFGIAGGAAGMLGGIFSASGPPLIFLLYKQPFRVEAIKASLICTFCVFSFVRLGAVTYVQGYPLDDMAYAIYAIPTMLIATFTGQKIAPFIPDLIMRRSVFCLLVASGISLMV